MAIFLATSITLNSSCMTKRTDIGPYTFGQEVGKVTSEKLTEISGMAPSGIYPETFWVNNDSGDDAKIYLINLEGELIASLELPSAENRDWEGVATGDGYIFVGEIGDNRAIYPDKRIFRIPEPQGVDLSKRGQTLVAQRPEVMQFNFADAQRDSESLAYDPLEKQLLIISKREEQVKVYTTPFVATAPEEMLLLESHTTLDMTQATSADIALDGSKILVKTYMNIYFWKRAEGQSLIEALSTTPTVLNYEPEPQGEAIAWSTSEDAFYTLSEKNGLAAPVIYKYLSTASGGRR